LLTQPEMSWGLTTQMAAYDELYLNRERVFEKRKIAVKLS